MFDQTINSSVTVKTIFIITPKQVCCPMHLSGVDTQLPDVVERLFAGWSHPAVEPLVAPIAVLQVHVLVPAGSIVKFL